MMFSSLLHSLPFEHIPGLHGGSMCPRGQRAMVLTKYSMHLPPDPTVSLASAHSIAFLDWDSKLLLSHRPETSPPGELNLGGRERRARLSQSLLLMLATLE